MKTYIILFSILVLSVHAYAQTTVKVAGTIKGKVIHAKSNEAISYTNIGIEGTFFGTASDEEGNFELKIPEEMVASKIFFSAVGFKNVQFQVSDLLKKEFNVIKLDAQSYGIEDVDIAAQNKVLIRILRMASENIPYNYIQGPHNLVGKYSYDMTADTLQFEREGEVLIYDKKGYKNPSIRDAYNSVKYSIKAIPNEADFRFSTGNTKMDELLALDWVRSSSSVLNPSLLAGYNLSLKDETEVNGLKYWIISFSQIQPDISGSGEYHSNQVDGEITINKEDYSVLEIKGNSKAVANSEQHRSIATDPSSDGTMKNVSSSFTVRYKSLKPEYIELVRSFIKDDTSYSETARFTVDKVKTTGVQVLKSRQYFTGEVVF